MTAVVAWKRQFKQGTMELCFVSDSRIRDGRTIDISQKIFTLKRGDIAIAFAGDTAVAYPYALQVVNASDSFRASRTRALDIIEYRSHVINILNQIFHCIQTPVEELRIPDVEIVLGGYSWIKKEFKLWKIRYFKNLRRFHFDSPRSFGGTKECIVFAGDKGPALYRKFLEVLHSKYGRREYDSLNLDFEPLEAMVKLLKGENEDSTVGGYPQLAKVYQHLNAIQIPVFDDESRKIALCGRELLDYERVDEWPISLTGFHRINPRELYPADSESMHERDFEKSIDPNEF